MRFAAVALCSIIHPYGPTYSVERELSSREDSLIGAEERLAASVEQVRHDLFRLMRAQQALFVYMNALAKTILTCVPEPPADAKPQALQAPRKDTTGC